MESRKEGQLFAVEGTGNTFSGYLRPERFRFKILHDQGILPQRTGGLKCVTGGINQAGIHDAGKTKRSPGDGDGFAIDEIVDHFVFVQVPYTVCLGRFAVHDGNKWFVGIIE